MGAENACICITACNPIWVYVEPKLHRLLMHSLAGLTKFRILVAWTIPIIRTLFCICPRPRGHRVERTCAHVLEGAKDAEACLSIK